MKKQKKFHINEFYNLKIRLITRIFLRKKDGYITDNETKYRHIVFRFSLSDYQKRGNEIIAIIQKDWECLDSEPRYLASAEKQTFESEYVFDVMTYGSQKYCKLYSDTLATLIAKLKALKKAKIKYKVLHGHNVFDFTNANTFEFIER